MTDDDTLNPRRRLVIGVVTLILAATGFVAGRTLLRPAVNVTQPIAFNHQKHVKDVGVECTTCHEHFNTSEHSGLPSLVVCEGCHTEPLTESPEEQRLLALIAGNPRPEFHKLFRLPDHVYYSHRRHVAAGGLACETCHGAIAETTSPPTSPLESVTMDVCVGCHAERGVKTGCADCHR